jgi:ribosomal-protein-alanine N-acetyltransferase
MAATRKFPVLSTKRLTLRAATPKDVSALHAMSSIPDVTRFNNWPDAPAQAKVERALRWMSKVHASGKGCAWIISSKAFAGAIRFNSFEKKWKCGEIGYELHPDYWGKGLMTEAVRAIVACGHEVFRLNRIDAWTLPGNAASDRLLVKAGFRHEGTLRPKGVVQGRLSRFSNVRAARGGRCSLSRHVVPAVIARSVVTKQSSNRCPKRRDCFAEPVIGRRCAPSRWLAMTISTPRFIGCKIVNKPGRVERTGWPNVAWMCTLRIHNKKILERGTA